MAEPNFIKRGVAGIEESSRPSRFVTLKAGESVEIVPLTGVSEIISFHQHTFWLDEGNSPIFPCLQTADCPGCQQGNDPRFRALLLVKTKGDDEEKVFGFGMSVMRQLAAVEEAMGGSMAGSILRLSRQGTGLNTKWTVMPTNRTTKVEEPETDIMEFIGPITASEIREMLTKAGIEPKGKSKSKSKKSEEDWTEVSFEDDDE